MTKENQETKNEKPRAAKEGGTDSAGGSNGKGNRNRGGRKNNTSFKRVNLERKRPQLSRGEGAEGSSQNGERPRRRRGSKASKDPMPSCASSRWAAWTPSART